VLLLTIAGFFAARQLGEMDAERDSSHRADIAATQLHDRVAQAETLVDGVRRVLSGHDTPNGTTEQLPDVGALWLNPAGLPAAAWVERVPAHERASYERRTGHRIVMQTSSGGLARAGLRKSYLPATLVTGFPPMSAPGLDLGGISGIAATVVRPETAYRVRATFLSRLPDGTTGLFLVQSAQRLNRGRVEPGFAVLFLPASWLLSAADTIDSTPTAHPRLQIAVSGASVGDLSGADTARSKFAAAGQRFEVRVPKGDVRGAAAVLPWIVLAGGVVLAALAGALEVISARRAKARAELDRLFTISPDLIVVSGFDGYFKRVNPAFERLLGYTEQEALARPFVEFVHPDDRERTRAELSRRYRGKTAISFQNRYVHKDGSYRWIEWTAVPVVEERLNYAVARDVTERRQAETDLREAEERTRALAEEQAALRRVATLVAQSTPSQHLFAAVAEEVLGLLPVETISMGRYESDETLTHMAIAGEARAGFRIGSRWPLGGKNVSTIVAQTRRPARVDSYVDAPGELSAAIRKDRIGASVGAPIIVEGRLWGVMTASAQAALPPGIEERLVSFTELVATAIANAESRAGLARLAEQQAALRRVATLVAEGVPPAEVFSALSDEVNRLFDAETTTIQRLEADGTVTVVSGTGSIGDEFSIGRQLELQPGWVVTATLETGRPTRKEDYGEATEGLPRVIRDLGIRSSVGVPIFVEGALWGAIVVGTTREHFADGTEQRLEEFTGLAATAIANAESREALARLADEQAALQRVATLVAHGLRPDEIFAAVSDEVGRLFGTDSATVVRYDDEGEGIVFVGVASKITGGFPLGAHWKFQEGMASAEVYRTGRSARTGEHLSTAEGPIGDIQRRLGIMSAVASPIVAEGRLWGAMSVQSQEPLPPDTDERLEKFTELVATAIANAESREALGRLADEQAALRRVATLVAQGVAPDEVFAAVSDEVARLVGAESATVMKFDDDGPGIVFVGVASDMGDAFPLGARWKFEDGMASAEVYRTGRSARGGGRDWATVEGPVGETHHRLGIVSTVASPIVVEGRLWGAMSVQSQEPLPPDTDERLEKFTELVATAIANAEAGEALGRLADEQAALRRVATLVAQGVPPDEVFAAVSDEIARAVGTDSATVIRYDDDGEGICYVGSASKVSDAFPVGVHWKFQEGMASYEVYRTGRSARSGTRLSTVEGPIGDVHRRMGIVSAVASPIVVEGRLWGAMAVHGQEELPPGTEQRVEKFTALVATAIANAEGRAGLTRLAEEQAALRRVATLVAEGVPPARVFSALSEEVSLLVDAEASVIGRLESNGRVTVLAASGSAMEESVLGTEFEPDADTVIAEVLRTGHSTRKDDYRGDSETARRLGIRSGVGIPIVVEGTQWGVVAIGAVRERFPEETEQRLEKFTELAATAIANAESRSELAASRVRIVAASDETRRRIERDLHDGTQQRLVSLSLELRLAESAVPPELEETRRTLDRVADELNGVIEDLREISRGIHPAILSEGGLGPALRTLARRSAIPVELDSSICTRLPEPIEVAAYYVVSEALANATKHAMANGVAVAVGSQNASLQLAIHDDGIGGADPSQGSGLAGLQDRVEALGGSIQISSPVGKGTDVLVELPLELDLPVDEPERGWSAENGDGLVSQLGE
jgi:PAS domain S-box-containing protein